MVIATEVYLVECDECCVEMVVRWPVKVSDGLVCVCCGANLTIGAVYDMDPCERIPKDLAVSEWVEHRKPVRQP